MEDDLKGEFVLSENKIVRKTPHFFSSFFQNPGGLSFQEQEKNEEIILLLRRHFITNVPWILFVLFLAILPITFPLLAITFPFPPLSSLTIVFMVSFYYLILFGLALLNFTLWYFHIGLVTNIRIVDIDLSGLLYRHVATARHESVEEVTYDQIGFVTSLFNYGNVHVQTAGATANIEFDRVPRPAKVADIIGDLANPV